LKTIKINNYIIYADTVDEIIINKDKKIVNTINAYSYIVAKKDQKFKKALLESDILLPDGEGIVLMAKKLKQKKIKKIAGADIHRELLERAQKEKLKCFYLGASQNTLKKIHNKLSMRYPKVTFGFFAPPFKDIFSEEDDRKMISKINAFSPDILFVGMTAPKQEKWVLENRDYINANIICSIGAVFDFIAETKKRAPQWVIKIKMEWLYRSFTAWRLTKRYLYSTPLFLMEIYKLKFFSKREGS
jgi:N-acetylglucosaminyldiphosphoundecaprenol N-acetyl-beta-D-mannosaminyltransferase